MSKNGKQKQCRVHRLIATTFLEIDPDRPQVNHIDGDKTNNSIENLEWCTQSENMLHAFKAGLEGKHTKKVIDLDSGEVYDSVTNAARSTGDAARAGKITLVCQGKRSHYKGRHFAYLDDYENGTVPKYQGKWKKGKAESLWQ